jgi:hypothetical protein
MNAWLRMVLVAMALLSAAPPALAQSDHIFAAGIGYSFDRLNDEGWKGSPDWFVFRLPRPQRLGIAWDIGSDSFGVDAGDTPAGVRGSLRVRHYLVGGGYTWRVRGLEITALGLTGPATSSFTPDPAAPPGPTVSGNTSWSGLVGVTTWIDLSSRWGVKLAVDYSIATPTLKTSGASDTEWRARRLHTQVGLVFGFY